MDNRESIEESFLVEIEIEQQPFSCDEELSEEASVGGNVYEVALPLHVEFEVTSWADSWLWNSLESELNSYKRYFKSVPFWGPTLI